MEKFDQINPEIAGLNEQERKQRIEFFLREEIGQAFDERNNDVREALVNNPELYERMRVDWIEAQTEIYHETEDLNLVTEMARQETKEAKINRVTGLENRAGLYQTLNFHFKKIFGEDVLKDREKFIQALQEKDFSKEELRVLSIDVSFLSLANEVGGHEKGDELLKEMASKIKNEGEKAVHLGGDELAVVYNEKSVEESISKINEGVASLEIDYLKNLGLKPHMDMGLAKLSEAVDVFNEFINELGKTPDGREAIRLFNPVKGLENIMTALADKRAFLKKGLTRIPLLINKKNSSQENYDKIIGSLRKGGYSATDKELEDLSKIESDKREEAVKDFIIRKEEEKLGEIINEFDGLRAELILKKALEKF